MTSGNWTENHVFGSSNITLLSAYCKLIQSRLDIPFEFSSNVLKVNLKTSRNLNNMWYSSGNSWALVSNTIGYQYLTLKENRLKSEKDSTIFSFPQSQS